ncbi:hypothetical protein [Prosthecobacter sp.]|uniref:hypothetical protein n=1 Tax=Prosthecobacter sp. TaxID=1965333 RepID=UPI003784C88F
MTLPSELISRLQALKALLDLGDVELASSAAARLQTHREIGNIAQIIECFGAHRYAEAGRLITTVLTEGTRLVRWADPEITLLEAELERLSSDLAEAEAEQADLDHQISRFHAAHHQSLGDRLAKLLRLRLIVRIRAAAADPTKAEEAKEAQQDFDDFQKESTAQEAENARTKWDLSEEEQQELKKLFRSASKKCHPDVVPVEHQAAAAAMFRDLTEAYQTGNLVRVRHLAAQAAAGVFTAAAGASAADQKATLQARIQAVRSALEKVRADLAAVQQSAAYHVMSQHPDWDAYFEIQAAKLDHEIERLSQAVEGSDS